MNYQIIGGDGKEYGPISSEGVTNWLQEGRANGDTRIKEVGAQEWQCVRDLPEFASAFSAAISAPPAGPVTPSPAAGQFPQQKPGKIQAIAIMKLVGGIIAILISLIGFLNVFAAGLASFGILCIFVVIPIFELVVGIVCTVQGAKLVGKNPEPVIAKTKTTSILQIICIISCDVPNLAMGIINLVFLNDEEVKAYIRSKGGQI